MPCPLNLLERGAVCVALYPYTTSFPLDRVLRDVEDELRAQLERHDSIESVAAVLKGGMPPEVAVTMKLRRVLLLQDGTSPGRQDITVARINSITEGKRQRGKNWYPKLQNRIHPAHYLLDQPEHGTGGQEAYADLTAVMTIRKASILDRTGQLTGDEMQDVSELLVRTLELDLSRYVQALTPVSREAT